MTPRGLGTFGSKATSAPPSQKSHAIRLTEFFSSPRNVGIATTLFQYIKGRQGNYMRRCWGTMTMPHTRYGQDLDRSRNMRTRNRRLGPLVQHPPPPLPRRHHTTTSRKSTHNNMKGSGLNKPPQNPGLDTPAKGHRTRYVALHPLRRAAPVTWRCTRTEGVQCLQIGCNAYRSGARPHPSQAHMRTCPKGRPRTRQAWLGPAAQSKQLAGPGGAVQTAGWARRHQTAGSARERQGLTGLRDDEPSGRLAAQTTSGPPSARLASLARHKARARGTHATSPGAGHTYDEAGTRRAKQRREPRPRQ